MYSRYTQIFFEDKVTGKELKKDFERWINNYGLPRKIICDNGKQYASKEFDKFLTDKGIIKTSTPMYHPASNGISERLNQTVAEVLRMYKDNDIKKVVRLIEERLNNNYHRGVKEIPIAIMQKFSPYDYSKRLKDHKPEVKIVEDIKSDIILKNKTKFEVKIGDYVLIRNFNGSKLDDLYIGPYEVKEVSGKNMWIKIYERKEWLHFEDIKLYRK